MNYTLPKGPLTLKETFHIQLSGKVNEYDFHEVLQQYAMTQPIYYIQVGSMGIVEDLCLGDALFNETGSLYLYDAPHPEYDKVIVLYLYRDERILELIKKTLLRLFEKGLIESYQEIEDGEELSV